MLPTAVSNAGTVALPRRGGRRSARNNNNNNNSNTRKEADDDRRHRDQGAAVVSTVFARVALTAALLVHFAHCHAHHLRDYGAPLGHYANLWVCNVSLMVAGAGIALGAPDVVACSLLAVSTGHALWTIDTVIMTAKLLVGVFVFDGPSSSSSSCARSSRWCCASLTECRGPFEIADYDSYRKRTGLGHQLYINSHHVWFVPAVTTYLRRCASRKERFRLTPRHLVGNVVYVMIVSWATHLTIGSAECVETTMLDDGTRACLFLNVNMIREWWGSNNVKLFHLFDRSKGGHTILYFFYANILYSGVMNSVWYFLLNKFIFTRKERTTEKL